MQHKYVVDTYIEIIKESFPDLITELNIKHSGVNIVSKVYDSKYKKYQREIGDGFLVMLNSTTPTKYEDLCIINKELDLGLKIELVDLQENAIIRPIKKDGNRSKIRVTLLNGQTIQHQKVFQTLLDVIVFASPERVASLGITVNKEPLVSQTKSEKYPTACKPVGNGWYVNTCSDTPTKYDQICQISKDLDLSLIVEMV